MYRGRQRERDRERERALNVNCLSLPLCASTICLYCVLCVLFVCLVSCTFFVRRIISLYPVTPCHIRRRENMVGVNMVLAEYHQI